MRVRHLTISFTVFALLLSGCAEKKVGLYEYIRKAHKYIEEQKYEKAIFLFHKAYEGSPESEKMRENLVYGYIKYADFLDDDGKLEKAINYLSMAYEMAPSNIPVINNLAWLYSKKAVKEAGNGEYGLAMDYLKRSTGLAMGHGKVRRNVSNYLFNKAVEAYHKNEDKTVFMCLYMSYLLKPRYESMDMLGSYFYKGSDFEKAKFYWDKALEHDPDNPAVREKLEKLEREMRVENKMVNIETPHFDVKLYKDYGIDIEFLKSTLDSIYKEVGDELRFFIPGDTAIILYTEEDFRNIFEREGIVRAFYDGKIRMLITSGLDESTLSGLISHEFTHAVVSMMTDNRCPVWLNEGLAVHSQVKYMASPSGYVSAFLKSGHKLRLDILEGGFRQMADKGLLGLSYEGAYSAVEFILDRWGWDGLRGLLYRIKQGVHFANAIDEEFYISREVFESMWNNYLIDDFVRE